MNIFKNNRYYDWYLRIINHAKISNLDLERKARHHIIPRSFFESGRLVGDKDAADNLVVLTPRQHFVCHWLLTKCVEDTYQRQADFAFWRMISCNSNSARITSRVYENALNRIAVYHSDRLTGKDAIIKGRVAYTNGLITKMCFEHPGDGWWKGTTQKGIPKNGTTNKKAYNNGLITKFFLEDPGFPWILGSLQTNSHTKGMCWWNDGTIELTALDSPGEGWSKGRINPNKHGGATTTGKRGWNNGETYCFADKQPGPEWVRGRIPRSR